MPFRGEAQVKANENGLTLSWDLQWPGEMAMPPSPAACVDGLWEFDVIELFLAHAHEARYVELEFGPAGHWLALAFDGVRQRRGILSHLNPAISTEPNNGRWRGEARMNLDLIESNIGSPPWRILVAAIAHRDGRPHYLSSTRLPGAEVDFHQPGHWPLVGEASRSGSESHSRSKPHPAR